MPARGLGRWVGFSIPKQGTTVYRVVGILTRISMVAVTTGNWVSFSDTWN